MIPGTQDIDLLVGEKTVSLFIFGPLIGKAVSATIEFDGELRHGAIEIEKVDAAGVLPAKFEIVEAMVTQQTPEALLRVRGSLAELAGEIARTRGACGCLPYRGVCPSSVLRIAAYPKRKGWDEGRNHRGFCWYHSRAAPSPWPSPPRGRWYHSRDVVVAFAFAFASALLPRLTRAFAGQASFSLLIESSISATKVVPATGFEPVRC